MGFKACLSDADAWLRENLKSCGSEYYEYILVYDDDVLVVSHDPQQVMDDLSKHYTLKEGSVRPLKEYLGSDIAMFEMSDPDTRIPRKCWSMAANTYIKLVLTEVKRTLAKLDQRLKSKVVTSLADGYRPEIDATPELDAERTTYFQSNWCATMDRRTRTS
jgi:hypothetical protein